MEKKVKAMPICFASLNEKNRNEYLEWLKKCKATRVYLYGVGYVYKKTARLYTQTDFIKRTIDYFKDNDLEVGIWIDGFGHGCTLFGVEKEEDGYTQIRGIDGKESEHAFCPSDERFVQDYCNGVEKLATLDPHLIMIDDDFRFNTRSSYYRVGCFCDNHLKYYRQQIGEELAIDEIENRIFTGEKNKYRDTYYDMMSNTLLNFAKKLRACVDKVNPKIRLGACFTGESWDICGTSVKEISYALAGQTKPFGRISGAPYWNNNIIGIVEASRMQFAWSKGWGIELITEGDTYPRPRYNVPSKPLELFDTLIVADGTEGGRLSYIFDYYQKPTYETGYVTKFIKNEEQREKISKIFAGKTAVGVRVFNHREKARNYSYFNTYKNGASMLLERMQLKSPATQLLSYNSIPTSYEDNGYPVLVLGENAKYVTVEDLANGAILDVRSAQILTARGIDVGLKRAKAQSFYGEYFIEADDLIREIRHADTQEIEVADGAIVESLFMPQKTPASYRYENGTGQRFFVLAMDYYSVNGEYKVNYTGNYYRQEQLKNAIEWLGEKKLPAFAYKNPYLYMLAKKDSGGNMALAIAPVSLDGLIDTKIELDGNYEIESALNFNGTLDDNVLVVNYLEPYGCSVVKLKKK